MDRIIALLSLVIIPVSAITAQTCQISLNIGDIEKAKGHMMIAIFDNEEDYMKKPYASYHEPVKSTGRMSFIIDRIEAGKYAIAIFHDEDSNKELNSSIFGPPTEPYGFSRNARGFLGPAKFEDASFVLKSGEKIDFKIELE